MRSLALRHSLVEPERQRFGCSSQREPMLAGMIFPHLIQVFHIRPAYRTATWGAAREQAAAGSDLHDSGALRRLSISGRLGGFGSRVAIYFQFRQSFLTSTSMQAERPEVSRQEAGRQHPRRFSPFLRPLFSS
jgi:hypothetical protein